MKIGGIPFGSLISAIIVFVGVAVFCGTLYKALSIILRNVMEDLFGFKVSWYVFLFFMNFDVTWNLILYARVRQN